MATDLSKSSLDQLIDLIRTTNDLTPMALNTGDVDLTDLQALSDHPSGKNTGLNVVSKPNRRYTGTVPVVYNRLDVGGLSQYGDLIINITSGDGEQEILDAINIAYGTNLSFDDIEMEGQELIDYDGELVTFTAKANSLAWIGNITLVVKWTQTALNAILVNATLAGLKWPGLYILGNLEEVGAFTAASDTYSKGNIAIEGDWLYYVGGTTNGGSSGAIAFFRRHMLTGEIENLPNMPTPKYDHLTFVENGKIYVVGGRYSASRGGLSTSLCVYTIATNTWVEKPGVTGMIEYGIGAYLGNGKFALSQTNDSTTNYSIGIYSLDANDNVSTVATTASNFAYNYFISPRSACAYSGTLYCFSLYATNVRLSKININTAAHEYVENIAPNLPDYFPSGTYYADMLFLFDGDRKCYFIDKVSGITLMYDLSTEEATDLTPMPSELLTATYPLRAKQFIYQDEMYVMTGTTGIIPGKKLLKVT